MSSGIDARNDDAVATYSSRGPTCSFRTDADGFKVERSTDGVTYTQLVTLAVNSKSYASTSLNGGKKYYRVRSYNANGNSAHTAVVNATTPTK